MYLLELTQIGDSIGVILPEEVLARLRVGKGGAVCVAETPEGIVLTPYDPSLAAQVEAGRRFMLEHRDAFRELAK